MSEAQLAPVDATTITSETELQQLLQQAFKPANEDVKACIEQAVQSLAQQALVHTRLVAEDTQETVAAIIAAIDHTLERQLNEILHDPALLALEGRWRGLHYLVSNSETGEQLKIRVMNVSKDELRKALKKYKGAAWDQSPIFKQIYEQEYGQFGGHPYGLLVGDYYFDHSGQDVELLGQLAQIGAAAHTVFIAAAAPSLLLMESWQELANPRELSKLLQTPEHGSWRNLRNNEDSRYLGLTLPRTLARTPYGRDNPVDSFAFEEDTAGDSSNYCWSNAAYAMAVNIHRSYSLYGWCSRIRGVESGGLVEDLPTHRVPSDDGGFANQCPTEIAISDRREAELSKCGLLPLIHMKNSSSAVFIGAQSLQQAQQYQDPEATANAHLAARLPYMFACNRFAHYLKCMIRDKIGSFKNREAMLRWLQEWLVDYIDNNWQVSLEETKASRPLIEAKIELEEIEGNPGYYAAKFYLRPQYQPEGLTVSLRLVTKVPSGNK